MGPRVAKAGRGRGATSEDEAHQRPELHDGRSDWAALLRCIRYFSRGTGKRDRSVRVGRGWARGGASRVGTADVSGGENMRLPARARHRRNRTPNREARYS